MLLLCFFGVRFVMLASFAIFQLPLTISCSGMLSFAFVCFDLVAYSCRLAAMSCGFLIFFCFAFLRAGAFALVLLFVTVVCSLSLPSVFVCLFPCALALVSFVCSWAVRSQSYL